MNYDFTKAEDKWAKKWFESDIFNAVDGDTTREKKYVLNEFPYPSGEGLHMGHAFSYVGGDVYARYMRLKGYNVLYPMGWDAFGLPAENYAIKMKRKPQDIVKESTALFKQQMQRLGLSFDWSREVNTTDPEYYKWTQWIFLKLYEKGLAYKEEWPINWCKSCKIGLANEEVVNGKCERCDGETERRNISQWIVKITDYADKLIDGLEKTDFVEKVKAAQINWIDRKEWIDITYEIDGAKDTVTVATTRPDTNFGATFIVLAPEHPLVAKVISGKIKTDENIENIKEYVKKALNKSELERQKDVLGRKKTGVFTGLYAINMFTSKKMPIWIADFAIGTVGTGAVIGVPGHDMRDFEFAKQFGLEIVRVVVGKDGDKGEITDKNQVQEAEGIMINSGFLDGMDIHDATKKVMDYIEENGWGKRVIRYHLRDWIFSRQHYWGEPIPMINCKKCGWVPVPEKDLPVRLPEVENYKPTDTGESPLANIADWVNVKCPKCGGDAKRETDTMPNWAGSDWYYIRYTNVGNKTRIADIDKQKYWMPVDVYIGGDEHNTLHLLYSRFIHQFLFDIGEVASSEPYYRRVSHGVVLGPNGMRMSKSRGNVIVPDEVVKKVGSDAVRAYLMFMGPYEGTTIWSDNALNGTYRFVQRLYKYFSENTDKFSENGEEKISRYISQVVLFAGRGIESFGYNTVIAKFMEMINRLEKTDPVSISKGSVKQVLIAMSPFMPFLCEELWEMIGEEYSVQNQEWPMIEAKLSVEQEITIPIQINGKVRERITINTQISEKEIRKIIEEKDLIGKYLDGKTIKKLIYVPGKIVNVVV